MRKTSRALLIFTSITALLTLQFATGPEPAFAAKVEVDTSSPPKFQTVAQVISAYGNSVREKFKPIFEAQGVSYPPGHLTWIALKQEKLLYVFARDKTGKNKKINSYQIIGASGGPGPKLKEGDKQVPEGYYKLNAFRPNLVAHIGLGVNYPNSEDIAHANKDKRKNLGCDILIHGSRWSTGCLAMGNPAIEELFVLAYDAGLQNIDLVFAPCNLSASKPESEGSETSPSWLPGLYQRLRRTLQSYPLP